MKRLASLWLGMAAMTVSLFAGALLYSGSASAQTTTTPSCYSGCTNVVTPQVTNSFSSTSPASDGPTPASGSAPVVASASSSTLAFTGADVAGIVIVATILIAGGVVLLQLGRRRRNA